MRSRLVLIPLTVASAGLLLAACSAPAPTPGGGGGSPEPAPVVDAPAWYGSDFDADGCPVPAAGAPIEVADAAAFFQADVPAGWCTYSSTEYTQHYAIPNSKGTDFGADARAALEPAGWTFDAADDDSPQWSWITAYPAGAEEGFEDGAVDGAIFTVSSATQEDIDTYSIWFSGLPDAFGGSWAEGDEISVLGFW